VIYALGSRRPYTNAAALITGHTLAYMSAGIVLAIGFEWLSALLANPRPIDFVIEAILGGGEPSIAGSDAHDVSAACHRFENAEINPAVDSTHALQFSSRELL
jgi:hypothetical protein